MDLLNNDQFLTLIIILNLVLSTFRLRLMEWHQLLRPRMRSLTGVMILGKSLQPLREERIAGKKDVLFAALVPMESESPRTECFEHLLKLGRKKLIRSNLHKVFLNTYRFRIQPVIVYWQFLNFKLKFPKFLYLYCEGIILQFQF